MVNVKTTWSPCSAFWFIKSSKNWELLSLGGGTVCALQVPPGLLTVTLIWCRFGQKESTCWQWLRLTHSALNTLLNSRPKGSYELRLVMNAAQTDTRAHSRVYSRCGWSREVVVFARLTCQPVGCLCAFALGKHTHSYHFASLSGNAVQSLQCSWVLLWLTCSKVTEVAHLYLQKGFSSDLILKLAVCPLQYMYSRLTDVDPEGWRVLKDERRGSVCFLPQLI